MLSEANQIIGLIRFVAKLIGGALKWLRRPHKEKPLSERRVVTQKYFRLLRRRFPDGGEFRLSIGWNRSEEVGPALKAQGDVAQKRITLRP